MCVHMFLGLSFFPILILKLRNPKFKNLIAIHYDFNEVYWILPI